MCHISRLTGRGGEIGSELADQAGIDLRGCLTVYPTIS
jgi:hypothetical protein